MNNLIKKLLKREEKSGLDFSEKSDGDEVHKFTFNVNDGMPNASIDCHRLNLACCVYNWSTKTDSSMGVNNVVVSGYLDQEYKLRIFKLDFLSGLAIEI